MPTRNEPDPGQHTYGHSPSRLHRCPQVSRGQVAIRRLFVLQVVGKDGLVERVLVRGLDVIASQSTSASRHMRSISTRGV